MGNADLDESLQQHLKDALTNCGMSERQNRLLALVAS